MEMDMPKEDLKPALRLALRLHEIGDKSPYQLFFAGKGNSGASFGFMQGDLAAGQSVVTQTFMRAMSAAGMSAETIGGLLAGLSVHLIANPLDPGETAQVDDALLASRDLVDAMDESLLQDVYDGLDLCIATAARANRTIDPKAQLYIACWINMSGPPTTLLVWLSGGTPSLPAPVPPAGYTVDGAAMEQYLRATSYYIANPENFPHLVTCVAAGMAVIGSGSGQPAPARAASLPMASYQGASRMMLLSRAAAAFTPARLGAIADALPLARASGNGGVDSREIEVQSVFTTSSRWLEVPPTPKVLDLYFANASVDGFDFDAFNRHIAALGLVYFKPLELLFLGGSNATGNCMGKNSLPDATLWRNIDNTARMLDRICDLLGAPIHILSVYRAPDYNACVGGVPDSQHVRFNAIDWYCEQGSPAGWHDVATRVRGERPEFLGGIGIYEAGGFIHVDTRGSQADWSGPG
jgi:hypothetical protein